MIVCRCTCSTPATRSPCSPSPSTRGCRPWPSGGIPPPNTPPRTAPQVQHTTPHHLAPPCCDIALRSCRQVTCIWLCLAVQARWCVCWSPETCSPWATRTSAKPRCRALLYSPRYPRLTSVITAAAAAAAVSNSIWSGVYRHLGSCFLRCKPSRPPPSWPERAPRPPESSRYQTILPMLSLSNRWGTANV